jgi:phosphate transport system substrate-binding protein
MRIHPAFLAALCALVLTARVATATTLSGSDLLKGKYTEALSKATTAAGTATPLTLKFDGSLMGEKYLRAGRSDAALLFIPDKTKIREITSGEWYAVPLAFQTIVVVVHTENKLERIDLVLLADIFGKQLGAEGALRSWTAIPDSKLNLPIHTLLTRYDLSVATPMFRNRVLHDGEFRLNTSFFTNDAQSIEYLSSSPSSIGILAVPPPAIATVRVLALAVKPDATSAYLPTADNLRNGDYPLSVPLYLVIPRKNLVTLRPLLPVLFGDELAARLLEAGFVPVSKNLRKNFQQTLDNTL